MTNEIELPPKPVPRWDPMDRTNDYAYSESNLDDYACAAIEADRRLRAVPGDMVLKSPTVELTFQQIAELYAMIGGELNPDDADQEINIQWMPERQSDENELMPAGLYAWYDDLPEEGVIGLTRGEYQGDKPPAGFRPALAAAPTAAAPAGGADGEAV